MGQPVMQFQIISKNPEGAAAFYGRLFGWRMRRDNPLAIRILDTGSERGIAGQIWPAPPEAHAFVQLFIEVEDVDAAARDAVAGGGRVIVPPQVMPNGESVAILGDPEGIPFGVYRPA